MAAVGVSTPNGFALDDAPTPEAPNADMNGGAGSGEDEDLFGSDEDAGKNNLDRKLDDSELDSGDDQGRADRLAHTVEDDDLVEEKQVAEVQTDLAPIRPPEGDELYLLNLPSFLGLAHKNYNPSTYEAPTKPHDRDAAGDDTVTFSPFDTATSTIFWRRDPKIPDNLQSNARIIRWDDGSLTLQLANKPVEHYRITTSALRQNYDSRKSRVHAHVSEYEPNKDTNNYLAAYHASQGIDLQITRPLDASLRIQPTGDVADESVLRLQAELAAQQKTHDPLAQSKSIRVDPEEARRRAEAADKEAAKLERKRRNAQEAMEFRREQTLRRGGVGGRGGLSVAGLEDDEGMPTARGRTSKGRKRKINRRGEIYSDDEDDTIPRGRTQADEYDRNDDFLADSDEELETYEDGGGGSEDVEEEDEDADGEVDDAPPAALPQRSERTERPRERRSATPKRPAAAAAAADDDDAGPGVTGSPQARKKRRVIDDDDEDE